jgi:ribose 1,5-bisphosphokinase
MTARYALYYTPAPHSAWARFGADWLAQPDPRLDHPRRYGFHATFKAPFRLRPGAKLEDLIGELEAFARARQVFSVPELERQRLDDFLALVPAQPDPRLDALAAQCVKQFDRWRAPLDALELDRRRREPLTQRQEALLARWGYPHVLEEYRFHLSLTGPLRGAPEPAAPALPDEPLDVDAVSLCEECAPGATFRVLHRAPFARRGRLVYVVGASGSGKDALIGWMRERRPPGVAFAQRRITRPAGASGERHIALGEAEFDAHLAREEFALHWCANGHRYGIAREIDAWLEQGLTVVVNGSREHLPRAAAAYPQLEVVHVTAPEEVLRARLAARAREGRRAIEARLARRPAVASAALEINNAGALEAAGERLLRFLGSGR